jgi:hypothetical protein
MENNELYIFTVGTRTFGGRAEMPNGFTSEGLTECAEFIPMFDNRGNLGLVCVLIGSLETIPQDSLVIKVDKKSLYYQSYIKTTSGIEISGKGIA